MKYDGQSSKSNPASSRTYSRTHTMRAKQINFWILAICTLIILACVLAGMQARMHARMHARGPGVGARAGIYRIGYAMRSRASFAEDGRSYCWCLCVECKWHQTSRNYLHCDEAGRRACVRVCVCARWPGICVGASVVAHSPRGLLVAMTTSPTGCVGLSGRRTCILI